MNLETLTIVNVPFFECQEDIHNVLNRVVCKLRTLKGLHLQCTGSLAYGNAHELCSALQCMPQLRVLELPGLNLSGTSFVQLWQLIPALGSLERLDLSYNEVGIDDESLRCLDWGDRAALHLRELILSSNAIEDNAAEELSLFFSAMPELHSVAFAVNNITAEGIALIVQRLRSCEHLQALDVAQNDLKASRSNSEYLAQLPHNLARLPQLKRLDISGCNLHDNHAAQMLELVPCYTHVRLGSCNALPVLYLELLMAAFADLHCCATFLFLCSCLIISHALTIASGAEHEC